MKKVGIFIDGNYFSTVSNHYNRLPQIGARINISGMIGFFEDQLARFWDCRREMVKVGEAHYFRGRLSANEASARGRLFQERVFDEVLMRSRFTPHYLPLNKGQTQEKGVDVQLAVEVMSAVYNYNLDAVILVVCDGDYVSLIKKIQSRGVIVMTALWAFDYIDDSGTKRETLVSSELASCSNIPLNMTQIIDNGWVPTDFFMPVQQNKPPVSPTSLTNQQSIFSENTEFTVKMLKDTFGFLYNPTDGMPDIYFNFTDVENAMLIPHIKPGTSVKANKVILNERQKLQAFGVVPVFKPTV